MCPSEKPEAQECIVIHNTGGFLKFSRDVEGLLKAPTARVAPAAPHVCRYAQVNVNITNRCVVDLLPLQEWLAYKVLGQSHELEAA